MSYIYKFKEKLIYEISSDNGQLSNISKILFANFFDNGTLQKTNENINLVKNEIIKNKTILNLKNSEKENLMINDLLIILFGPILFINFFCFLKVKFILNKIIGITVSN